jgi:hypothetical protein
MNQDSYIHNVRKVTIIPVTISSDKLQPLHLLRLTIKGEADNEIELNLYATNSHASLPELIIQEKELS